MRSRRPSLEDLGKRIAAGSMAGLAAPDASPSAPAADPMGVVYVDHSLVADPAGGLCLP